MIDCAFIAVSIKSKSFTTWLTNRKDCINNLRSILVSLNFVNLSDFYRVHLLIFFYFSYKVLSWGLGDFLLFEWSFSKTEEKFFEKPLSLLLLFKIWGNCTVFFMINYGSAYLMVFTFIVLDPGPGKICPNLR